MFEHTLVLPGATEVLIAADRPLTRDPEVLSSRLRARGIRARLVSEAYVEYRIADERVDELAAQLAAVDVPANSDTNPICYPLTLALWLAKLFPVLTLLDFFSTSRTSVVAGSAASVGLLLVLILLARRRQRVRRILLAAVAGLAGLLLETVLILSYQTQRGVLFADLGLPGPWHSRLSGRPGASTRLSRMPHEEVGPKSTSQPAGETSGNPCDPPPRKLSPPRRHWLACSEMRSSCPGRLGGFLKSLWNINEIVLIPRLCYTQNIWRRPPAA